MDEQWCGSLHVGLTTLAPPELPSCPLSALSPSLPQLRSKVTWLLCGSEVQRNGALQRQNYCCSLERLKVSWKSPPPPPLVATSVGSHGQTGGGGGGGVMFAHGL